MKKSYKTYLLLALLTILFIAAPVTAGLPGESSTQLSSIHQNTAQSLEQRGKAFYDAGQFSEAIAVLQQASQEYEAQNDRLRQAVVLGNLALAYQQLSQWSEAEAAINQSLSLLEEFRNSAGNDSELQRLQVLAQVLDTQGTLYLAQGRTEQALDVWERAVSAYKQVRDDAGLIRSRINQSQALQTLGFYRRAVDTLTELSPILRALPDSALKASGLRSLGDALAIVGDLDEARQTLQQSLTVAQQLADSEATAAAQLSLGNLARTQADFVAAQSFYEQAATVATLTGIQAQINCLSLLIDQQQWTAATQLLPQVRTSISHLPQNRSTLYAQINYAQSLLRLAANPASPSDPFALLREAGDGLEVAYQQARAVDDRQAESYAIGMLGRVYETTKQASIAQELTQQALQLAQSIQQPDISYQWQWQLGRILNTQGQTQKAIEAYETAYTTLLALRQDIVTTNRTYQIAFQDGSAPFYREYISLLLANNEPVENDLKQARQVATSLQVAELENFLRRPCIPVDPVLVDTTVDRFAATTAVIYPIALSDRLEVIVKLPQEEKLEHFRSPVSLVELQQVTKSLQLDLEREYTFDVIKANANQLYQWIVSPIQQQLKNKNIDTLVFALDGSLRNIPMGVLYDGNQYLIENYAVAMTLGLDLPAPSSIDRDRLKVLAVGLTDPPQGLIVNSEDVSANFAKLNNVNLEIDSIAAAGLPMTAIRDRDFTNGKFNQRINESSFPIVHMATHGQFSSDAKSTFLLTADGAIGVNQLSDLFKARTETRSDAIELLVLNACETAAGDQLAALGIAGTAFRAGARSVLASLWTLDDTSSVELTHRFYQQFSQSTVTKAEALRQAQLDLLANPQFEHPRYWATYVLVGNWL